MSVESGAMPLAVDLSVVLPITASQTDVPRGAP